MRQSALIYIYIYKEQWHTGDGSNVDNVSLATVWSLLEDGQDSLRQVDEAGDVGSEHDVQVILGDFRRLGDTLDKATGRKN